LFYSFYLFLSPSFLCFSLKLCFWVIFKLFLPVDPTIEDSYRKQAKFGGGHVLFELLDTAGQEEFTALMDQYYRESPKHSTFMIVSNFDQPETLEAIEALIGKIQRVRDGNPFSIVLVRGKSDLNKPMRQKARILKWSEKNKVPFLCTSAKEDVNVELAFRVCALLHLQRCPGVKPVVRRMD
jgi:GTPase KRas protein